MTIRDIQQKRLESIFEKYSNDDSVISEDFSDDNYCGGLYFLPDINEFEGKDGVIYTKREF